MLNLTCLPDLAPHGLRAKVLRYNLAKIFHAVVGITRKITSKTEFKKILVT